jgi:hypothetical protein
LFFSKGADKKHANVRVGAMTGAICGKCGAQLSLEAIAFGCPICKSRSIDGADSPVWPPTRTPKEKSNGDGAAKRDGGVEELLLRFLCTSCCTPLTVPLRSLGIQEKCPGCRQPLTVPTLNDRVVGLDVVINWAGATKAQASYNSTAARKKSSVDNAAPESSGPAKPPPPPRDPPKTYKQNSTSPNPTPKRNPSPSKEGERDPASPYYRVRPDVNVPTAEPIEPEPDPAPAKPGAREDRSGPYISPRFMRYFVYGGIWVGPFVPIVLLALTGLASQNADGILGGLCFGACFGVPWFFAAPWVAYFLTPWVLAAIYSSVRCPHCGESHPLVSRWSCGCGYNDHCDRHVLLFRCPKCSSRIGSYNCSVCEATILF